MIATTMTYFNYGLYGTYSAPLPDVPDDRHNPKMWAKWFRDFLFQIIPQRLTHPGIIHVRIVPACIFKYARDGIHAPEWTMKLWKQAHCRTRTEYPRAYGPDAQGQAAIGHRQQGQTRFH